MVERLRVSPIVVSEVTDLPEPDSPTMPSVVPALTEYEMPSTACTIPSSVVNATLQVLDLEQRRPIGAHEYRTRGSMNA